MNILGTEQSPENVFEGMSRERDSVVDTAFFELVGLLEKGFIISDETADLGVEATVETTIETISPVEEPKDPAQAVIQVAEKIVRDEYTKHVEEEARKAVDDVFAGGDQDD